MDLAHVSFSGVEPDPLKTRAANDGSAKYGLPAKPHNAAADNGTAVIEPLAVWMLEQAGVNPAAYRATPIQRRITACLRQLRVPSSEAAYRLLVRTPELLPVALDTMLIGVSSFFRDAAVFACLRTLVLPELLRTRRGIRVYAAGVSNGQELYSVAMLLAEMSALEQSELLGLDCRPQAIAHARAGTFDADEFTELSPAQQDEFFPLTAGGRRRASPQLRSRIEWCRGDLTSFEDFGPRQLILFRNVAIYLEAAAAVLVWERLSRQLECGGFLVSGKAEQPPRWLPLTRIAPCIYRKL